MKRSLTVANGVLPVIALADGFLPQRPDFVRYRVMLNQALFALAPMTTSPAAIRSPRDPYLASGCSGLDCVATLKPVSDTKFKKEVPAKRPNEQALNNIYADLRP